MPCSCSPKPQTSSIWVLVLGKVILRVIVQTPSIWSIPNNPSAPKTSTTYAGSNKLSCVFWCVFVAILKNLLVKHLLSHFPELPDFLRNTFHIYFHSHVNVTSR